MMLAALIVFIVAIVGGITIAVGHREDYKPPKWVALGHGGLGGVGILLLFIAQTTTPEAMGVAGTASLVLFVVGAFGGGYLFTRRFKEEPTPKKIIAAHGTVQLIAFMLLVHALTF